MNKLSYLRCWTCGYELQPNGWPLQYPAEAYGTYVEAELEEPVQCQNCGKEVTRGMYPYSDEMFPVEIKGRR